MHKIHFIGIGGIGLSAIARFLNAQGYEISGSDIQNTSLTEKLKKEGIKIYIPHTKNSIKDQDLVVYSAVIKEDNEEIIEAKKKGIKVLSRREFLPYLLGDKKVISVCGAHGKSTTSAILASILKDDSAIIGAESKDIGSNAKYKSDLVVFEADESDGSFIDSNPYIAVVTNTEEEHMEFYNYDKELFFSYYKEFLKRAKIRVANGDDEFIKNLDLDIKRVFLKDAKFIRFEIRDNLPKTIFEYRGYEFEVYGFGEHIVLDALLAIEAANEFMDLNEIAKNIKNYKGIKKRFDIIYQKDDFVIIDDYGHHPTEIKATLKAAKEYALLKGIDKITAIWQPHKYSRTLMNLKGFEECFSGVDKLIILPVWAAGEEKRDIDFSGFNRYNLEFANRIYKKDSAIYYNDKKIDKGLVIGFGAGDITYQLRGEI